MHYCDIETDFLPMASILNNMLFLFITQTNFFAVASKAIFLSILSIHSFYPFFLSILSIHSFYPFFLSILSIHSFYWFKNYFFLSILSVHSFNQLFAFYFLTFIISIHEARASDLLTTTGSLKIFRRMYQLKFERDWKAPICINQQVFGWFRGFYLGRAL